MRQEEVRQGKKEKDEKQYDCSLNMPQNFVKKKERGTWINHYESPKQNEIH